jgi:6-phosphofructokinase
MIDAASAIKYWYFIRIMGRAPSHATLECALQTQPNIVIISEEIHDKGYSLLDVVQQIADTV